MDITTIFLAQIWGPVMLATGVGFFTSRGFYTKVYRDLEKAPFAVVFFGMLAIGIGILQVQMHNVWNSLPEVIVSLFGWSLLVKGIIATAFPSFVDKSGDWALSMHIVPVAGTGALLLGAYLSWIGYFA